MNIILKTFLTSSLFSLLSHLKGCTLCTTTLTLAPLTFEDIFFRLLAIDALLLRWRQRHYWLELCRAVEQLDIVVALSKTGIGS